jgi:hypothetical protein
MNGSEITTAFIMKKYSIVIAATLFGALAHAFEEVRKAGWKGWAAFISDIVVCSFIGSVFFHMAILSYPDYSVLACSVGAYWGPKGFNYVRDWVLTALKANFAK